MSRSCAAGPVLHHEHTGSLMRRIQMFGLCVRFTCKDAASAQAYDRLVAETVEAIKANEPGTLVYATHLVDGQPLQRIFYELYRDKAAFEAHEAAPHTRRYLDERGQYLASTEVDRLTLQTGKGTGPLGSLDCL